MDDDNVIKATFGDTYYLTGTYSVHIMPDGEVRLDGELDTDEQRKWLSEALAMIALEVGRGAYEAADD